MKNFSKFFVDLKSETEKAQEKKISSHELDLAPYAIDHDYSSKLDFNMCAPTDVRDAIM